MVDCLQTWHFIHVPQFLFQIEITPVFLDAFVILALGFERQ